MPILDVASLGLSSAMVALACSMMLMIRYGDMTNQKEFLVFSACNGLYGSGLILVLCKYSLIAVMIGNTLCIISFFALHYGICWFCGRKYSIWFCCVISIAYEVAYIQYGIQPDAVSARIIIISITQIIVLCDALRISTRLLEVSTGFRFVYLGLSLYVLSAAARAITISDPFLTHLSYYDDKGYAAIYYLFTTICRIILTIGLVVLVNETIESFLLRRIRSATEDLCKAKDEAVNTSWHMRMMKEAAEDAKEVAEREVAIRRNFIAAASHDLRQPVHSLGILTKTLADVMKGAAGENCRKHYELAALAAEDTKRLAKLLEELLDLARLQAVEVPLEQAAISFNSILDEVQRRNIKDAHKADVMLQVMPTSLSIKADGPIITRALSNLVQNAIKFSKPGGMVLIGCRRLKNEVLIDVHDKGPGIPKDKLITIFEPFTQVNNKERNSLKGYGLGLSIVKEAVRVIGGRLIVSSKVGQGTVFSIRLETA